MAIDVQLVTTPEAAEILGVVPQLVHRYRKQGRISGRKVGNVVLYDLSEIKDFAKIERKRGRPKNCAK